MVRRKADRRIARTRLSLHVALNTLILEKGYDATTIKDITERADVGRSTFYAHHGGKEGLLLSGLEHLRSALLSAAAPESHGSKPTASRALAFSPVFFEHLHEHRRLYQTVVENRKIPAMQTKIKKIVAEVFRLGLKRDTQGSSHLKVPEEALVSFLTETLFSIVAWWFKEPPGRAPGDADRIFRKLAIPALNAAGLEG
jgi:AcrR family transcriptional regulator